MHIYILKKLSSDKSLSHFMHMLNSSGDKNEPCRSKQDKFHGQNSPTLLPFSETASPGRMQPIEPSSSQLQEPSQQDTIVVSIKSQQLIQQKQQSFTLLPLEVQFMYQGNQGSFKQDLNGSKCLGSSSNSWSCSALLLV